MKTPSQHTPGPWFVKTDGASETYIDSNSRRIVCPSGLWDYDDEPILEEVTANARLIAAAPELLDALEDCHVVLESIRQQIDCNAINIVCAKASIAIQQATGAAS